MKNNIRLIICFLLLSISYIGIAQNIDAYAADPNPAREIPKMTLVWSDEFNIDGKPDAKNWKFEKGFVRNEELQWYQPDNANCKDGLLVIEGKNEQVTNTTYVEGSTDWKKNRQFANYTSSSIISQKLKEFQYGRFEIRARIDTTMGSWPAIWTKGITGSWPFCGEIDIMEFYRDKVGSARTKPIILANTAWGHATNPSGTWNTKKVALSYFTDKDPDWCNKFHTWRMDWSADSINLYLDDEMLNTTLVSRAKNPVDKTPLEPHRQKHFILINLAMGSNGGNIASLTKPIKYEVDYVRVYQPSPTAVKNQNESLLNIYPNPTINNIHISCEATIQQLQLFDVSGRNVLIVDKPSTFLNLANLSNGVYFLKLKLNDGIILSERIVKVN